MAKLSPEEIARLASDAGWTGRDLDTAVAVALAESWEGDPNAVGDVGIQTEKWGPSVGLWQIRSLNPGHGSPTEQQWRDYDANFDPATNARNAHAIWQRDGWRPWATYTEGTYRKYLDTARQATGSTQAVPPLPSRRGDAGGSGGGNGMSATLQELMGSLPKLLQQSDRLGGVARRAQQAVARGGAFGDVPGSRAAEQGNQGNASRHAKQAEGSRDRVDRVRDGVRDSGDRYERYDQDQGRHQQQERIQLDNAYDAYRNYA